MLKIKINGWFAPISKIMKPCCSVASTIDIEIPEHENPDDCLYQALRSLGFHDRIARDIVSSGATITIRKSYRDVPKEMDCPTREYFEEDEC